MDIVTLIKGSAVTTTIAIAEGIQNEHASVILLVRKYIDDLNEFGLVDFKSESSGGRPTEFALLNEQQSTLLLTYMRNSDVVREFKKRLVKAFWKMSQQVMQGNSISPSNLSRLQLLEMAMQAEQERLELEHKVSELAPKAEALDRIATHSEGSFCVRDAAKTLQMKEKVLRQALIERSWMYRRPMGRGYLAYADKLKKGLMEHKMVTGEKSDGSEWTDTQARITAKGMVLLSEIFSSELAVN